MLIILIWLGSVLPLKYIDVIKNCQAHGPNHCLILQEAHWNVLFDKYKDMLDLSLERVQQLTLSERTDILRLLYLYDIGGIYSNIHSKVDFPCLYDIVNSNKDELFFGQDQSNSALPSSHLVYAPSPKHPELKRIIQHIKDCEKCKNDDLAGNSFLKRIGEVPLKDVSSCIKQGQIQVNTNIPQQDPKAAECNANIEFRSKITFANFGIAAILLLGLIFPCQKKSGMEILPGNS